MRMAPVLRVLGLLTIALAFALVALGGDRTYTLYIIILASVAAAWFFAGAEALTCLHSLVENTRPKQGGAVTPVSVPTAQGLSDAVRAMEEARRR
jgi:hypothetical protein